jgi:hypothetical protein
VCGWQADFARGHVSSALCKSPACSNQRHAVTSSLHPPPPTACLPCIMTRCCHPPYLLVADCSLVKKLYNAGYEVADHTQNHISVSWLLGEAGCIC